MPDIECFLLEKTDLFERSLRRYTTPANRNTCNVFGYHNASVAIGEIDLPGLDLEGVGTSDWPKGDKRWPNECECGYRFKNGDEWQYNTRRLYRDSRFKRNLYVPDHAPVGAMWEEPWRSRMGPDGRSFSLMTPAGPWWIDGPASNGGGWIREGEPPRITVRPSILMGKKYHGWLRDGFLVDA